MKWFFQKFQDRSYGAHVQLSLGVHACELFSTSLVHRASAGHSCWPHGQLHVATFKIYHRILKNNTDEQGQDCCRMGMPTKQPGLTLIAADLPPRGPSFPEGCKRSTDVCVNVSHQGELPDQRQRNRFLKENKRCPLPELLQAPCTRFLLLDFYWATWSLFLGEENLQPRAFLPMEGLLFVAENVPAHLSSHCGSCTRGRTE